MSTPNRSSLRKDEWNARYNMDLESLETQTPREARPNETGTRTPSPIAPGAPVLEHVMTIVILGK